MRAKSSPAARALAIAGAVLLVVSLVWTIVYYESEDKYPIRSLGELNVVVAFVLFAVGAILFAVGYLVVLSSRRRARRR